VAQGKVVARLQTIAHLQEINAAVITGLVLQGGIVVEQQVATQMEESVAIMAGIARPVTNAILWMATMHAVQMQNVRRM
jgi:6,7-dimethyl-8-ribityllumazine synthase